MRMKIPAVLALALLSLALCIDGKDTSCRLAGQWKNDLGSNMTIDTVFKNGTFFGKYLTAVSSTSKTIVESPLIGYQQLTDLPSFGFTVKWRFSNSITVFTGQCFVEESGQLVLQTTWLLRSEAENLQNNWQQTRVGYNIFRPVQRRN
ncbi:PREDICTED: avidin-like [Nanorana parkeri]|uniref:avidin-like n=1 Tax=Nanorana parkeri TaxID=125878 RepID=UPI000854B338|nr:PREDICTED: avidin-like [Nanorana parkeri]